MSTAIIVEGGQIVSTFDYKTKEIKSLNKQMPTTPTKKPENSDVFEHWYDDNNLYPQNILRTVKSNEVLSGSLNKLAQIAISGGIRYGKRSFDETGNEIFTPTPKEEVNAFLKMSNVRRYIQEGIKDLVVFGNMFAEIVLTEDRSKITAIATQNAEYCRYSKIDPATGLTPLIYVNADWDNVSTVDNEFVRAYNCIDPYYGSVDKVKLGKAKRYIYPVADSSNGSYLYSEPPWQAVLRTKWIDISKSIPEMKLSGLKNALSVKYHIEIPADYWADNVEDWHEKKQADKDDFKKQFYTSLIENMQGEGKSNSTVITTFKSSVDGKVYDNIKITPLKQEMQDKWIEDSIEASSHLLYAVGIDPTIMGNVPGKSQTSAGSGSDKRVAMNIQQLMLSPLTELLCEPLNFISDYNGWGVEFWIHKAFLQTSDNTKPENRV